MTAISVKANSVMLLVAGLLAACSPAHGTGPVDRPPPAGTPQAGDIVLRDAAGEPARDQPPTVTVKVGQTIAVVLTIEYDTSRGIFVSEWTPGASSPLPSGSGHEVNIPTLKALGGNRFQAVAVGRATLAAQVAHSMDAAPLIWRAAAVVQQ